MKDFLLTIHRFAMSVCHSRFEHVTLNIFQAFFQIQDPFILIIIVDPKFHPQIISHVINHISSQFNVECNLVANGLKDKKQSLTDFDDFITPYLIKSDYQTWIAIAELKPPRHLFF